MPFPRLALATLAFAALASAAWAQPPASPPPVVFDGVDAPATLQVSSTAIRGGGLIAPEFSGYGRNVAPPVAWSGAPPQTRAFALIVQDPDGHGPQPVIHWVAYDIPGDVTALSRRTDNEPRAGKPQGMLQGPNSHGGIGWTGPHPPVGDPAHHYHIQVFALDRKLKLKPGASLDALQAAMQGHVLAKGQTIGLFAQAPPPPPKG